MANSDLLPLDQLHEEELVPAEETKPSAPTNVLGSPPPSAPIFDVTKQFFSGSLPPQFQLDSNFSRARVESGRVPKAALMPFGIQSNPSTNAAIQSSAVKVVQSAVGEDIDTDVDTPVVNLQTGTQYTVQQSDLNKLISINNAAGGTIFLPPVTGTTNVSINNNTGAGAFFNAGNTTVVGQVATSTASWTATGSPLNAGDILVLALRLVGSPSETVAPILMSDNQNGNWATIIQSVSSTSGVDTLVLAYIMNQKTVAVGGSLTLTLSVTYSSTVFNPSSNTVFNMTGLKSFAASAQATAAAPGAGGYTFGTAGLTITSPSTFIAIADEQKGGLSADTPDAFAGTPWTAVFNGATALGAAFLLGITNATVKEVWHANGSANDAWGAILAEFVNATASDIQQFTNNFFCYVENKGTGTFNLVSSLPIDGVSGPVPLTQNQGALLFYDANSNAWYTVRGIGGSSPNTVTSAVTLTNNAIILGAGAKTVKTGDLTGDATTSGSNAVTVVKVNGASIPVSDLLVGTNGSGQFVLGATAVNAQSGTTYTFADTDRLKVVTITNSAAMAITLPQAGASSQFVAGWFCYFINRGTGIATITPTTSTINGNATLVLQKNQAVIIVSDGTNYVALGTLLGDQNTTLTDGFLLSYDGTNHKWIAVSPGSVSGISAVALRGVSIAASAATPGNQNVLMYNSSNNDWEPVLADGMEHGDPVWWADAAFFDMREEFLTTESSTIFPSSAVTGPIGDFGWTVFGSVGGAGVPRLVGGNPPHAGIVEWGNLATSNGYAGLFLNALIGASPWLHIKALPLLENPGWKARWIWKWSGDTASSSNNPVSFAKKSFYAGFCGAPILSVKPATTNGWTSVSPRPDHFIGVRYDTSTVPGGWGLTSVANASAGTTVYTMSASNGFNGGTNTFVNCTVVVRGCTNAANNGSFTCTASSTTTMTLNNASGVSESVPVGASLNILKINITAVTQNSPASGKVTMTYVNLNSTTSPGANGGFIGLQFTGTGFTNGGNNVTGTCVGSTATTIILNFAGVTETPTANTAFLTPNYNGPDSTMILEVVDNPTYTTGVRHNAQGTTFDTGITPVAGNWYRLEIDCTATGQVKMTLFDENNATNATHTFTVSQLALALASTSWSSNASKIAFGQPQADAPTANSNVPVNQILPFVTGSSVTISGFTAPLNVFNGTWTMDEINDGSGSVGLPRIWFFSNNASVGAASQTSTWTGYPALTPYLVWGDDDTGANSGTSTYPGPTHIQVDAYHFAWNKAIASPSTIPSAAKSRYW